MSTFAKVALVILGLAILLPGLCFVFFGVWFAGGWLAAAPDMYGFYRMAPWQLLIGAVLTIVAILIFRRIGRQPPGPPSR